MPDAGKEDRFLHFQNQGAYGPEVHSQPMAQQQATFYTREVFLGNWAAEPG